MTFTIQSILQLLIVFQSFFFAVFLLMSSQGKRKSNYILALLLLIIGIQMGGFILRQTELTHALVSVNCAYGFIYGPLVYFYTKSMVYRDFKFSKIDFLHAMPFVVVLLLALFDNTICKSRFYLLYLGSVFIYILLSLLTIRSYRTILKHTQSDFDRLKLSWLQLYINIFMVLIVADMLQMLANLLSAPPLLITVFDIFVFLMMLLFITSMVFKGLMQPKIFMGINKEDEMIASLNKTKYAYSNLSKNESKTLLKQLEKYMTTYKPYLEPSLSLSQLADLLEMPSRHLSQAINQHMNKNFLDYINTKRIEESMEMLINSTDKKETIKEIMYAVGFNSRSSFHTAFKKKVGLSPSEFKAKHS